MKIVVFIIVVFFLFSKNAFSQNSAAYFPMSENGDYNSQSQKFMIISHDDGDTTEISYQYGLTTYNNEYFIVTNSFANDSTITTTLIEKITPRGLKFNSGINYNYIGKEQQTEKVKGGKKVMYPFKSDKKLLRWSVNTKHKYSKKVIVRSKTTYEGTGEYVYKDSVIKVLKFKRESTTKYKRHYFKETINYTFEFYMAENIGMVYFTRTGDMNYTGILIENKFYRKRI